MMANSVALEHIVNTRLLVKMWRHNDPCVASIVRCNVQLKPLLIRWKRSEILDEKKKECVP